MRQALSAIAATLAALATAPAAASAIETDPTWTMPGLQVAGSQSWRSDNSFTLVWDDKGKPPLNLVVRWLNTPWDTTFDRPSYRTLSVPAPAGSTTPPPGAYIAEAWLENATRQVRGPAQQITLRFDDAAPAPPSAAAPASWLDDDEPVTATIRQPVETPQASGLVGYAVSLTPVPNESPCADPRHCAATEVDLPLGDQQLQLPPQLEGISYLHVATVSGAGVASATRSVPIRVDAAAPTVRFGGVPSGWVDHPVAVSALSLDAYSGTAAAGANGPFTALAIDGGTPVFALGAQASAVVAGEGVHRLSAWARDGAGNTGAPGGDGPLVRIDETPPRLAFTDAQLADDPELIRVAVDDERSGPDPERGAIAIRPAGASAPFQTLPTKREGGALTARWSSDDYPPGSYEFRATAFDAAGNAGASGRRADGAAMVLRNPIKAPTRIASGFGGPRLVWQRCHRVDGGQRRCHREAVTGYGRRPTLRTVPYGRSLHFGGVLLDVAGHPLAGQPVEVVETFGAGADAGERRTTVLTGAHGRFGARLAPGPSRWVEARFAGTRTLTRAAGERVSMAVRAGLRFRASTEDAEIGGKPVIFSGRLLSGEASIPRTGRPIQLEFRVPGGSWSEFRTVVTDRDGRFRYPYAFTDDDSRGIRFQFRAVSPEQAGWPYRPAASAPVAVTGY